jgi:hypothetical protein
LFAPLFSGPRRKGGAAAGALGLGIEDLGTWACEKTWIEWEKSGIQQRKWKIYRNLMEIVGLIGFNQPSNCDCTIFKMI